MPRLKVYRTAIGFHDAYVAAPSQKAALKAWGVDKNLFARGAAEVVDDPALTREPLAHPGKIVRKSRGSLAEQLHALGPSKLKSAATRKRAEEPPPRSKRERTRKPPPPSRAALEAAEAAVADDLARAKRERAELREREQTLASERKRIEEAQQKRAEQLAARLARVRERFNAALARWAERSAE